MERPDRSHEGSRSDAASSAKGYLVARLRDPDPEVRARFAEAAGIARASVATPFLCNMEVADSDARARDAARVALDLLSTPVTAPTATLRNESEAIFALFNEYVAHRMASPHRPRQADLICPVAEFLSAWGDHPADDVDEIEGAALAAVHSIAGFLGVPNSSAGVKFLSFQGARRRVAEYEALIAGCNKPDDQSA